MRRNNLFCIIEPESKAFIIVGIFFANPVKFLKNETLVFWGNTDPVILDTDEVRRVCFVNSITHRQFSATILYGIVQQIYKGV